MALGAGDDAVDARDWFALEIFLLERWIAHERVAEAPGRLIGKHIQMSALVGARGPALGHVVRDIGPDIEPFGIPGFDAIDVHERLEQLLFEGTLEPKSGFLHPDRARPGLGLELKQADAAAYEI